MKLTRYLYCTLILSILLGTYQGRIALWKTDSPVPVKVFPNTVASLPPADQALLEQGIPIASREQLAYLLEDYLS